MAAQLHAYPVVLVQIDLIFCCLDTESQILNLPDYRPSPCKASRAGLASLRAFLASSQETPMQQVQGPHFQDG